MLGARNAENLGGMLKALKYEHANFTLDDGKRALVRCEECDRENYALNVLSGVCTWCGYNINKRGEDAILHKETD